MDAGQNERGNQSEAGDVMTNNLANPLEELEKIPAGVLGQLAKLPGDIVSGAAKQLLPGGAKTSGHQVDPLTGLEIPSQKQVQQLQKREKKQRQSGLAMMRQTIAVSQKPQTPENPKIPPPVAAVKSKFSTGERKHGVGG